MCDEEATACFNCDTACCDCDRWCSIYCPWVDDLCPNEQKPVNEDESNMIAALVAPLPPVMMAP